MTKDTDIFLRHIFECIEIIEEFIKGVSKSDFLHSIEKQDAIIRRLEIIGEATKNIPLNFRRQHTEINWNDMAGMRDKLIHHYFRVDVQVVWDVVKKDLPDLKRCLKKVLKDSGSK